MENPIVRVEHLYHRYTSSRWAIEDINFQIDDAGVVGLLGSNGAGKSTTMNIICGVMRQTAGEVYIGGINTLKEPVKARKLIGFLPQKPPLYPDLTVDEYLRFCAEIQWMDKKKIKSAIAAAEERCGITHMKDRLLRNLSGGYQQRVGLAQACLLYTSSGNYSVGEKLNYDKLEIMNSKQRVDLSREAYERGAQVPNDKIGYIGLALAYQRGEIDVYKRQVYFQYLFHVVRY